MSVPDYIFPARAEFLDREADLARLEEWWRGRDRDVLALYGRRRVGKSWLFRAFAHEKPAVILVAERRTTGAQLDRFASKLEEPLGLRPDLPDLATLFRVLYRMMRDAPGLVVIDEFPYLLPTRSRDRKDVLTSIQAVIEEERDQSQLKLILCGSNIHQMTMLLSEGSPIRGRLRPMHVAPLSFAESQPFMPAVGAAARIERYAVTGGMAMYLAELAGSRNLARAVTRAVVDPGGPLFNDPREVLEEEFSQPGVRFSLLEELAGGERGLAQLGTALRQSTTSLTAYLDELEDMHLIKKLAPMGSDRRDNRYRLTDNFLRFWFRFVFPAQDDLRSGLRPADHWSNEIEPALPDHVAPVFEDLCREFVRRREGIRVGAWWGHALNQPRRAGTRQSEEVDVVGVARGRVVVVGECKWTGGQMSAKVLSDLEEFKVPALRQDGARLGRDLKVLLFSKSGFKPSLVKAAANRSDVELIGLSELDATLRG